MSQADQLLSAVLDADRALRAAEDRLLDSDLRDATKAIEREVQRCLGTEQPEDAEARLVRLSSLLLAIGDSDAARLLLQILGHDEPAVRVAAGEALVELMYDRYAEVARQIEAGIDKGLNTTALSEVPFLLAEVGEPGGVKIASRLLRHADADVVGAAIEALAAMGDPSVLKQIEGLKGDTRKVAVEDEDEPSGEVTVGELASEAAEFLRKARGS
jgi:hypothetical protein